MAGLHERIGRHRPRPGRGPRRWVFLPYDQLRRSVWSFLFGWACVLVILTGSVAAVAVGFAEYFSHFFPALGTDRILATFAIPWGPWSISAGQLVAAGSIAIITAINYVGVRVATC